MFLTPNPTAGFAMPACGGAAAWHLVAPGSQLRTQGVVSLLDATRVSGVDTRDRIVPAGLTFPGAPAWRPPT